MSELVNAKIADVFSRDALVGDLFGLEVEAEYKEQFIHPLGLPMVMKADGSLRGHGVEYVSTPAELDKVYNDWKKVYWQLKDMGIKQIKSPRTSVHVHVNVSDLSVKQTMVFVGLLWLVEESLMEVSGPSRKGNNFCLPISHVARFPQQVVHCVNNHFLTFAKDDRYSAINLHSLTKFGTIEFRMMRGEYDPEFIKNWMEIINRLKQFSLRFKTPTEMFDAYYKNTGDFLKEAMVVEGPVGIHKLKTDDIIANAETNEVTVATLGDLDWTGEKDWRRDKDNETIVVRAKKHLRNPESVYTKDFRWFKKNFKDNYDERDWGQWLGGGVNVHDDLMFVVPPRFRVNIEPPPPPPVGPVVNAMDLATDLDLGVRYGENDLYDIDNVEDVVYRTEEV